LFLVLTSDLVICLRFAFLGDLWFLMTPGQEPLSLQYAYSNAKAALERLNKLFELEQEPISHANINPFTKKGASIRVEGLSFAYAGGQAVLKDINMQIKAGARVASNGPSGSGKTTLAKLLCGFYPPKEGKLYFNETALGEIGLEVLRQNLFVVLQQPVLFNNTLRFNLTMGDDYSEEAIFVALKIAQLEHFVKEMPLGLESIVGKGGVKLSGGQKQRLSIARMILADPSVVIFDESTSALDVHTESDLFEALKIFLKDRTIITIAHRLSTVQNSDYIYVMKDGLIVEEGEPQVLMEAEGHYNQFVTVQH